MRKYNRSALVAIFQIALQRPWTGIAFTAVLTIFAMFCATKPSPAMNLLTKVAYIASVLVFGATLLGMTIRLIQRIRMWIRQKRFTRAQKRQARANYRQQEALRQQQQAYQNPKYTRHYTYTKSKQKPLTGKTRPESSQKKEPHPEFPSTKQQEGPLTKHFRTLELQPGADMQTVKAAYHDLIKVWHPDRYLNDPRLYKRAEEKTKEITLAYHEIEKYNR